MSYAKTIIKTIKANTLAEFSLLFLAHLNKSSLELQLKPIIYTAPINPPVVVVFLTCVYRCCNWWTSCLAFTMSSGAAYWPLRLEQLSDVTDASRQ